MLFCMKQYYPVHPVYPVYVLLLFLDSNMTRGKLNQITFLLAGIYNNCWGLWISLHPNWLFRFAGMELPNYPEIFVCVGMVVGLYGIVYLEIARRPERGFLLALVGFIGKILGP